MTITEVRRTKKGRISVYVDGEYLFAVENDCWQNCPLCVGGEVDEQQLNDLLRSSNETVARRSALNMLSARDYTSSMLTERLARKTDAQSAKAAVEQMEQLGYIDDEQYALRYCQQLLESKLYGRRRIRFELQKRRIPNEVIQSVIEQTDWGDEAERALALLRRRFSRVDNEADRRRAASLLERSGYGYEDIRFALREMSGDTDEDLF